MRDETPTVFVAPSGDDTGPDAFKLPFVTLDRARDVAAPGAVVTLRGGTYRLTAEHSGGRHAE